MPFPGEAPTPMPGPIGDAPPGDDVLPAPAAAPEASGPIPGLPEDADIVSIGPDGPPPEAFGATALDGDLPEASLGYDPTADPPETTLHLSPGDSKPTKLKCPKCDTKNNASSKTCSKCGHELTQARKAKFANMSQPVSASIYERGLKLDAEGEDADDGLVWKAVCKTGTLALSPGPGQIDVEKPLELTEDMFDDLIMSVEEQAFPHITVPLSHDNGILENTGYVRKVKKAPAPDGEKYLMAGIEFTEPEVKTKVLNKSIADTSVGVKFNYRNKRSGKLYPAALEHVALTQIPWVDGLPAFGQALSQPYDQEQQEQEDKLYAGVFAHDRASVTRKPASKPARPRPRSRPAKQRPPRAATRRKRTLSQDILPRSKSVDRVPAMPKTPANRRPTRPARQSQTVEQLLAAQQARTERLDSDLKLAQKRAEEAEAKADDSAKKLELSAVKVKVGEFQAMGHSPAAVTRYEQIALAAIEAKYGDDDENTLTLSVTPSEGGDPVETQMGPVEVAEYMLSAVTPISDAAQEFLQSVGDQVQLAQPGGDNKSASEKADELERKAHPERYNDDGSRKAADQIEASPGGSL